MLKVSIITVVYNNRLYIQDTIESVLSQTYPYIEYIVIDGNSTDGTFEILQLYKNKIAKIVSEDDDGIYYAMNKGINLATGEIIAFLNSDDVYNNNQVIMEVIKCFERNEIDCVYGDLAYVNKEQTTTITRYWKSEIYKPNLFKFGWQIAHPTFFVKKEALCNYGLFDVSYKIAADYELILRLVEKNKIKSFYLSELLVRMREGGTSNKNIINIIKGNQEIIQAWKKNKLKYSLFFFIKKPFDKLIQLLIKPSKYGY